MPGNRTEVGQTMMTLHVFVSSPNDCGPERQAAKEVIDRVNASAIALAQRIVLKPLLWEDLPPGLGPQGDGQSRINEVLKRSDLSRYEIYLGCMRARIGTPTGRGRSGTIEEFEQARDSFCARRLPSEILFYFVGAATERSSEVEEFRRELDDAGVLYSQIPDTATFAARLELHLLEILGDWWRWPKRTARAKRYLRPVLTGVLSALLLASVCDYFLLDLGGLRAIKTAAASNDPRQTVDAWRARAPYLFFNRNAAIADANEAMHRMLLATPELEYSVQLYTLWENQTFAGANLLRSARQSVAARVSRGISAALQQLATAQAFSLLNAGDQSRIWRDNPDERSAAIRSIAEAQLFASVLQRSGWVTNWESIGLRDFEIAGLRAFGQATSGNTTNIDQWGTREQRLALILLANRTNALRSMATAALSDLIDPPAPEIDAFMAYTSEAEALEWISQHVKPGLPGYKFAAIVNGVKKSGISRLALSLLDATLAKQTPFDFLDTDHESFLGLPRQDPALRRELSVRVLAWAKSGAWPESGILEMVLPYVRAQTYSPQDRDLLATRICVSLAGESPLQRAETEALELLVQLNTPGARKFLEAQLKEYVEGRIFGGDGQRAALMRNLPLFAGTNWPAQALKLSGVTNSASEDDDLVQTEYLKLIPSMAPNGRKSQRSQLRRVIDRRALRTTPGINPILQPVQHHLWQPEFDDAAKALLEASSWEEIADLLSFSPEWEPLAQFDGRFQRWDYLLRALSRSSRAWPAEFTKACWKVIPPDGALADFWLSTIAMHGGETARNLLAADLTVRPVTWWKYLGLAADTNSLGWIAQNASLDSSTNVGAFASGVGNLPDDAKRQFLASWLPELAGGHAAAGQFWIELARDAELIDPRLVIQASNVVERSNSPNDLPRCIGYLSSVAPKTLQSLFANSNTCQNLKAALGNQTQAGWTFITQEISLKDGVSVPDCLIDIVESRPLFSVVDKQQVDLLKQDYFVEGSHVVYNHLIEQLALSEPDKLIPALLRLIERAPAVEGGEILPNRNEVYRAYCAWVLALSATRAKQDWQLTTNTVLVRMLGEDSLQSGAAARSLIAGVRINPQPQSAKNN